MFFLVYAFCFLVTPAVPIYGMGMTIEELQSIPIPLFTPPPRNQKGIR